jgi:hypothetical protein
MNGRASIVSGSIIDP